MQNPVRFGQVLPKRLLRIGCAGRTLDEVDDLAQGIVPNREQKAWRGAGRILKTFEKKLLERCFHDSDGVS
jgi:hypothetical protein